MNSFDTGPAGKRHNLSDWMTLHDLDGTTCRFILDIIDNRIAGGAIPSLNVDRAWRHVSVGSAWLQARDALCEYMPAHQNIIEDTFENANRVVINQPGGLRKAVTIDNGPGDYATIIYSFRGEPPDCLIIAHEFGHAVQLRASQGRFVSPIMREICAFVAEAALLSHVQDNDPDFYSVLERCWLDDNDVYLGRHGKRLGISLSSPDAVYRYSWNYPIARFLAERVAAHASSELVWDAFEGRLSVKDVLRAVGGQGPWR